MKKFIIIQFWPNQEAWIIDDEHGNTRWFDKESHARDYIDNDLDKGTVAKVVPFDFNFEKN